jgi:hypothetical protein
MNLTEQETKDFLDKKQRLKSLFNDWVNLIGKSDRQKFKTTSDVACITYFVDEVSFLKTMMMNAIVKINNDEYNINLQTAEKFRSIYFNDGLLEWLKKDFTNVYLDI